MALFIALPAHADDPAIAKKVLIEICEKGVPEKDGWPTSRLETTETYSVDAMALFRLPFKYIDTGVRADRPNPFLVRATVEAKLPPGNHRILLRGRGPSRLHVAGKELLKLPFRAGFTDGHNAIPTDYLDLAPDFRFKPPGNREKWTTWISDGKTARFELETIIGGVRGKSFFRPELGETVVAVCLEGETTFRILAPTPTIPYTDAGWIPFAEAEELRLRKMDAERRAKLFADASQYWKARREHARRWLETTPEPKPPTVVKGDYPVGSVIDRYLAAGFADAVKEASDEKGTVEFHKQVRPVLEARCFQCHQGTKAKGGLRLDSLSAMTRGGDSDEPAVVSGKSAKSPLLKRILSTDAGDRMPPQGDPLTKSEIAAIKTWIDEGARWPKHPDGKPTLTPATTDLEFLRRVTLDTVGVAPSLEEIQTFLADAREDKRDRTIERLLADPRWADHWTSYWQDVLGENPNILNPTLNNSGPFRWWIHEALLDDKPMDVFVTELVRMRGSHHQGGPAGFAAASENDVPLAEKGIVLTSAFLGVQMKCARCHDAPAHESTQKQLFEIASLLNRGPLTVPKTSSVPLDKIHAGGRKALITVTLSPGTKVKPAWPLAKFSPANLPATLLPEKADERDRLALWLTLPENDRFPKVVVNRLWRRLMGRGIVEPVDDWEKAVPTNPDLLDYLARELVRSGYRIKHVAGLILRSNAYQRQADPKLTETGPLFAAPARRRLTAEQIVDSLFAAAGLPLNTEEINLDIDGGRDAKNSISLGKPRRAWEFASTSNERDRPSLTLPRVQAVVDVLEAFGWKGARQDARTYREESPNVLQPAILANGSVGVWLTRLSDQHGATRLALSATSPEELVDQLFLKALTRYPTEGERADLVAHLRPGFEERIVALPPAPKPGPRVIPKYVSWSNHLSPEANSLMIVLSAEARRGPRPTQRLAPAWRERMEDVLWAVLNSPEFFHQP